MVSFRCDADLHKWAAAQALKRNWTLSTFIHELLKGARDGEKRIKAAKRISRPEIDEAALERIAIPQKSTAKAANGKRHPSPLGPDSENRGNCPRCGAKLKPWGPLMSRCVDCGENFNQLQVQAGGK